MLVLWSLGGFLRGVSCVLVQDYCPPHLVFFPIYILFCNYRAGWLARINFSVTESTYRSCVCLCSVDEDEDDDEGDEDEELESPGGAENTRSLLASLEPLRKAKSWGSCSRALVGEPKSTGDEKLTVTDPSGPATKVSGRGDCQTHSLVSVRSLVSFFFVVARTL